MKNDDSTWAWLSRCAQRAGRVVVDGLSPVLALLIAGPLALLLLLGAIAAVLYVDALAARYVKAEKPADKVGAAPSQHVVQVPVRTEVNCTLTAPGVRRAPAASAPQCQAKLP